MPRNKPWSFAEQAAVCAAYWVLLRREMAGEPINKAEARRTVLPLLDDRSAGSYEMKMCNISAMRASRDETWIKGYKPLGNAQKSLVDAFEYVDKVAPATTDEDVMNNTLLSPAVAYRQALQED